MANYALVYIGTIAPPTSGSGFTVTSFVDVRSDSTIFPQFSIDTPIEQTDSPNEINRKVLESTHAQILSTLNVDVPIRNLTLFAAAS